MKITRTNVGSSKGMFLRCIVKVLCKESENVDTLWKEMTTHIRKVAIEVFGVTRENKREPKNTWWRNDDVQKTISERKECYKYLHHNRSDENIQKYKETRRNTKKTMSEARGQIYAEMYWKLDTKEGENDVYKMTKLWERKIRDFNQVKCIKDEVYRFLVKGDEIKNRWREYFNKLFNDESEKTAIKYDDSVDDINRRFVQRI
jgi:hypothetical protein